MSKPNKTSNNANKPGLTPILMPLGLMGVIFILSSIPMDAGSRDIRFLTDLDPVLQNLLHIPLYGALSFLWMLYFTRRGFSFGKAAVFSFLITSGYGFLDEIHQTFVPGRYGGLLDILLDAVGAVAGIAVYRLFKK